MSDQSSLQPEQDRTGGTVARPTAGGGMEAGSDVVDYRDQLRSSRWNAAPLQNPEVEKTDGRLVVLGVVILSAITFVVLVLGYSSGFWG